MTSPSDDLTARCREVLRERCHNGFIGWGNGAGMEGVALDDASAAMARVIRGGRIFLDDDSIRWHDERCLAAARGEDR